MNDSAARPGKITDENGIVNRLPNAKGLTLVSTPHDAYVLFQDGERVAIIPRDELAGLYEQARAFLLARHDPVVNHFWPSMFRLSGGQEADDLA